MVDKAEELCKTMKPWLDIVDFCKTLEGLVSKNLDGLGIIDPKWITVVKAFPQEAWARSDPEICKKINEVMEEFNGSPSLQAVPDCQTKAKELYDQYNMVSEAMKPKSE